MESLCYRQLGLIEDLINNYEDKSKNISQGFSYDKVDAYVEINDIKELFSRFNIPELLKEELKTFLKYLDNDYYKWQKQLKRIEANNSDFMKTYNRYGYLINHFIGKPEYYRVFPESMKELISAFTSPDFNMFNTKNKIIELLLVFNKKFNTFFWKY